jgi:hypothetical protein
MFNNISKIKEEEKRNNRAIVFFIPQHYLAGLPARQGHKARHFLRNL